MEREMGVHEMVISSSSPRAVVVVAQEKAEVKVRRGPWSVEEDLALVSYIDVHGEGRWNSLARSAGLRRSGKSCRLRWLNYLRPDVRRGNITPEEQLLILQLHSRWGNRWSKIAQHLPGRTDNEVKNFWRTRVQKHAKQLKCDVNSQQFRDAMRFLWMPRLMEKIHEAATTSSMATVTTSTAASDHPSALPAISAEPPMQQHTTTHMVRLTPDNSATAESLSDSSAGTSELSSSSPVSELTGSHYLARWGCISDCVNELPTGGFSESDPLSSCGYLNQVGFPEFERTGWGAAGGFSSQNSWFADDIWF